MATPGYSYSSLQTLAGWDAKGSGRSGSSSKKSDKGSMMAQGSIAHDHADQTRKLSALSA